VQLLEQEGVVASERGVGVRVLPPDSLRTTPLTFGMVYPFQPDGPFAGTIHTLAERAIDLRNNHCITTSSGGTAASERQTVNQLLACGVEGLIVWPVAGEENVEFFQRIAEQTPMVLIDRTLERVPVPAVSLDWARAGREIVQHLCQKGYQQILIFEESLPISSYRQMYNEMRRTIDAVSAQRRFTFVSVDYSPFFDQFPRDPRSAVRDYQARLEEVLSQHRCEAFFMPFDEFIDRVYACGGMHRRFPMRQIVSLTNTHPTSRSLEFYDLGVREWVCDFGAMIGRATDILHEKVYLKSRIQQQIRLPLTSVIRTSDVVVSGH
jgi:DNA-binding LacI/PurR family transcriptional regulator